jgi:ectoine hydroxylase-related dioxygenase (phytanoyl-CoA dioxygenase family)
MEAASDLRTEEAFRRLGITPRTLIPAEKEALDHRGYIILPGLIEGRDLDRLRTVFDLACEEEGIPPSGTRHPKTLLGRDPAFADLLAHPRLMAAVWHILGRPFRLGAVAGRDPLPGYGPQGLHIDWADLTPPTRPQAATALGLLDPFTEDNGATRLVPGSHRARKAPPKSFADPASRHPDQVLAIAPAGSVLVFNAHLWHGGTGNRSTSHRRAVQCSFAGREHARPGAPGLPGLGLSPDARFVLGLDPE